MPIFQTIGSAAARAYGLFRRATTPSLTGNYLWQWGTQTVGNYTIATLTSQSSPVQITGRSYGVVTGWAHTMAITQGGALWVWGGNALGKLGDGTTVSKSSPVQVGTLTNWATANAGAVSSGAIKTDGTLWTWGSGAGGLLGNGTTTPNLSSPVQVGTLTNWSKVSIAVAAGYAVKTDGTLWSWGTNSAGQLGDGTTVSKSSPVQVGTLTTWSRISARSSTAIVLKTDGTLWGFGQNTFANIGDGTTTNRSSPVQVGSFSDWVEFWNGGNGVSNSVSAGVRSNGTLWVWGGTGQDGGLGIGGTSGSAQVGSYNSPIQVALNWNSLPSGGNDSTGWVAIGANNSMWSAGFYPTLGNGNSGTNQSAPVQIGNLFTWSQCSVSVYNSAALKTDGTLWTWGTNDYGQIGNGTTNIYSSPVQVGTLTTWSKICAGYFFMGAVKTDGTLWTWGRNNAGQLGDGTTTDKSSPIQVGTLSTWASVSCGQQYILATKTDGTLWAWGANGNGQLGTGSGSYSSPVQVGTLTNWATIFANSATGYAVKTNGTFWGWGDNVNGQIGDNTTIARTSPVQVGTLTNWAKPSSCGGSNGLALKTDGTIWSWGASANGALGDAGTDRSSPVQIGTLTNWIDVAGGKRLGFALNSQKKMYAWGDNSAAGTSGAAPWCALGADLPNTVSFPSQVGTLTNWSKVIAGENNNWCIATTTSGTLWGWGNNAGGQFGNGTLVSTSEPVQIGTQTNLYPVSSGVNYTLFKTTDNLLFATGASSSGNLGQTGPAAYSSPVQVGLLSDKFASVGTNANGSTAVKADGTLWGWGENQAGQVGNGTTTVTSGPAQVGTLTTWSKAITLGNSNSAGAIKANGSLWTWGLTGASQGYTGQGMNQDGYGYPIQFGQKVIANGSLGGYNSSYGGVGFFSAFVDTGGRLWTKGNNAVGQLGLGDSVNRTDILYQVGTLTNWASVSCGKTFTIATKTDGTLWAWGQGTSGQLGNSTLVTQSSPIQVGTLTNWSKVKASNNFSFAIKTNGTLWAWGVNDNYNLGDGTTVSKSSPVQIGTVTTWSNISSHYYGGYATRSDGSMWLWGTNNSGSMANVGTTSVPTQLGTLTNWSVLPKTAPETFGAWVVKTDGTLWAWGLNGLGQLGTSFVTDVSSPVQVGTLTSWVSTGMATYNGIAIRNDGTAWGSGMNSPDAATQYNYVGAGAPDAIYSSPIQVGSWIPFGSQVIAANNGGIILNNEGYLYSWGSTTGGNTPNAITEYLASTSSPVQVGSATWSDPFVKTDGTLWTWGPNLLGELGIGNTLLVSAPLKVGTQTNWKQSSRGSSFSMAVKTDGTLWAIGGINNIGQLGVGNTVNRSSPVQIGTLTTWSKVVCGGSVTWALKTDGTVWSWGSGVTGSLGNGTTTNRSSPVQITLATTAVDIGGSSATGFAVLSNGTLWGWGRATTGALGDGTSVSKSLPVQIGTLTTWTKATSSINLASNSANSSTPST